MTLSIWRYAHLALAVFSSMFLVLTSLTGAVLAVNAIQEKIPPFALHDLDGITVAEALPQLRKVYPEIIEIEVNHNGFVKLQGTDADGNDVDAYIDIKTGKVLGKPIKKNEFIQWVTSFHRSLFLHDAGRIFVGINAFLLFLISVSGLVLILKRQQGLRRFFSKIVKDSFSQYYHVFTGRIALIPILIISLTGTYLSLARFNVFPKENAEIKDRQNTSFIFKSTYFSEVDKIEFPFSDDPEEYYMLKLKDRELTADQAGKVLSETQYPFTTVIETLSLDLHTGRSSIIWAVVLGLASLNILFFIYSGFTMTLKRRSSRIRNTFKAAESEYILLAGSENGSTLRFANAVLKQLLDQNKKAHLTELNNYTVFPKAKYIIILTATHGLGEASSNGKKLIQLIKKHPQPHTINTAVVGFGSTAYPDFCAFAKEVDNLLTTQSWANPIVPLYTINDKSAVAFAAWTKTWADATGIPLATTPALYNKKPKGLQKFTVVEKTTVSSDDQTFMLTIKPKRLTTFTSGDLFAIYPNNDGTERLYSIGKVDGNILLVVKLHEHGLGSSYLNKLKPNIAFKARMVDNHAFHYPVKSPAVAMISNGTGIAPFLGMAAQNKRKTNSYLYAGFRKETVITKGYIAFADHQIKKKHLTDFKVAYSREGNNCYVTDLVANDTHKLATLLAQGGTIMICGSIAMQLDVEAALNTICQNMNNESLDFYKAKNQILADCY
ncbi:PepSY domain-containing protein [Flavobacterium psychrotrophum]|uniref:PepSY domain-containing protein n=1 Tax=Flavobacterium psychrotrophum TaxID=2294119 RepID=UPI000E324E14|nr:PepSY domain-containing protein [Flavobacterium psychrotrophum]